MRRNRKNIKKARDAVRFDDQSRFRVDIGYVAARQRSIELAVVIDEDCLELGIDRSSAGVASWCDDQRPPSGNHHRPRVYAALLGSKSEAAEAIKTLLANINDDHAGLSHTLCFRLHSDSGTEFVNQELSAYCREHAIHRTTTQGHDPNANAPAEQASGCLKRRCRYLLSGARSDPIFESRRPRSSSARASRCRRWELSLNPVWHTGHARDVPATTACVGTLRRAAHHFWRMRLHH